MFIRSQVIFLQVHNVSKLCFLAQFGLHCIPQWILDSSLPPDSFKSYFADFDDFEPIFSLAQNKIPVKMKVYFSGYDFYSGSIPVYGV